LPHDFPVNAYPGHHPYALQYCNQMTRKRPGLNVLGELIGALRFIETVAHRLLDSGEGAAYQRGDLLIFQSDLNC